MTSRVCPNCSATWYTANTTEPITCFWCETEILPEDNPHLIAVGE
jgi:predicted  nucleic acid-binding Zn ribbon protein